MSGDPVCLHKGDDSYQVRVGRACLRCGHIRHRHSTLELVPVRTVGGITILTSVVVPLGSDRERHGNDNDGARKCEAKFMTFDNPVMTEKRLHELADSVAELATYTQHLERTIRWLLKESGSEVAYYEDGGLALEVASMEYKRPVAEADGWYAETVEVIQQRSWF